MPDPVIDFLDDLDGPPLPSWDYGRVAVGTVSPVKRLYVINDLAGTDAVSAAEDLAYTTFDDAAGNEATDVVTDRWLEAEVVAWPTEVDPVTDPDGGMKPVGGSAAAGKKDLSAFPLGSQQYVVLDTRLRVPADPAKGVRSFVQRLEFKWT